MNWQVWVVVLSFSTTCLVYVDSQQYNRIPCVKEKCIVHLYKLTPFSLNVLYTTYKFLASQYIMIYYPFLVIALRILCIFFFTNIDWYSLRLSYSFNQPRRYSSSEWQSLPFKCNETFKSNFTPIPWCITLEWKVIKIFKSITNWLYFERLYEYCLYFLEASENDVLKEW